MKSLVKNSWGKSMLAADVHLAGGQFLQEEITLNIEKCVGFWIGTQRPAVCKREGYYLNSRSTLIMNSGYNVICEVVSNLQH